MINAINRQNIKYIFLGATIIVGIIFPFILNNYQIHVLILTYINFVMSAGFLLCLVTWRINFGLAATQGIGAYTSAMLALQLGWPFWATLPIAAIVAGLISLLEAQADRL